MLSLFADACLDALVDTARLLPFLFVTYLIMETLERRTEEKNAGLLEQSGRHGPLIGAALGVVPQCGFSAAAASLYAGGLISIGTLLSVFLSTSDEMLPILISQQVPVPSILLILFTKFFLGALTGFALDSILRLTRYRYKTEKRIHDLCEKEHCGCEEEEGSVLHSAIVHTLHIAAFILVISFLLTLLVEGFGEEYIEALLVGRPITGVLLSGLIGLIPNCASSIMITQLYLEELVGAGQMMAGLLVSAGVGVLVLFRTNAHPKENLKITAILYLAGVFWGILIELLGIVF